MIWSLIRQILLAINVANGDVDIGGRSLDDSEGGNDPGVRILDLFAAGQFVRLVSGEPSFGLPQRSRRRR